MTATVMTNQFAPNATLFTRCKVNALVTGPSVPNVSLGITVISATDKGQPQQNDLTLMIYI